MKPDNRKLIALLAIVVGLLFVIMQGKVISIALTLLGVGMIVMGILDLLKLQKQMDTVGLVISILKIILGFVVITSGWMFVSVALTVIAIAMLLFCAGNFVTVLLNRSTFMDKGQMISLYIKPVIGMAASVCLLFNQGGTVAWVFVVTGIIFVIEGILILMDCIKE